ncbi:MAG: hypothetical protein EA384_11295 [Spirochaetaceae bacterium]|nr:MAG: hypothetical protein EA384_11295 [Spirochaetaceae bacterium]
MHTTGTVQRLHSEPEFCPNRHCRFHRREQAAEYQWYIRFGSFHTRCRGRIQRFRCRNCGKSCSTQTFSIHYWSHYSNDLVWLLGHLYSCSGLRQAARQAGVTHRVIQNRTRRLARGALAVMQTALRRLQLNEDLAMDGFESYTRSQYHPNNITHVAGDRSQFIYAAVHTLLRRKGAMTDAQKRKRQLIDSVWKPRRSIRQDTSELLGDLAAAISSACSRHGRLRLATDCHSSYRAALLANHTLREQLQAGGLQHHRTSSRAARTVANPLFAINYVDRQMRKNMAEHVRETVRQGREVNCQMERMAVFMVLHNFCTPHRVTDTARADRCTTRAAVAGIQDPVITRQLERMVTHRAVFSHCDRAPQWIQRIWQHRYENPPAVRLVRGEPVVRSVALAPQALPEHLVA